MPGLKMVVLLSPEYNINGILFITYHYVSIKTVNIFSSIMGSIYGAAAAR